MSAKKTNISQIRKYLDGELDARAMHQLERQAQDDPFLMDALEGYEQAGGWQQAAIDDLDTRLQQRVEKARQRRLSPWIYLAAASVLIMLTIGYLFWPGEKTVINKQAKLSVKVPPPSEHIVTPNVDTLIKPPAKNEMLAAIKPKIARQIAKQQVTTIQPALPEQPAANVSAVVANDAVMMAVKPDSVQTMAAAFNKKTLHDTTAQLREIRIRGYAPVAKTAATSGSTLQTTALQNKVEGVDVTTPDHITGHVYDNMGHPLPGVSIAIAGNANRFSTDANGRFTLPATAKQQTLSFGYIGYEGKKVNAKGNDSINVALQPANISLSEAVVVGYGSSKKAAEIKEAHPAIGWDAYKQYLKKQAVLPNGATGRVDISFTVDTKGKPGNFHIDRGLNDEANQKAVDLVKNGPVWLPNKNGNPETLKLKIHFSKAE